MKIYKIVLIVIVLVGVAYFVGAKVSSKVEYKQVEKEVVVEVPRNAPVLERIARCESNSSHLGKNGQVLVVGNTNKSVDVGYYQINMQIWGAKATELKLNLMVEADNKKFGEYLYATLGTEPWIWSKKCWNK
jgi:cell division protein YceG involved in septum cleavage